MNDEQIFLANAYLDGELTDDERRIAEADPEVMAEVEELRALQAELRDVPPPTDAAREAAVAAAMAEFRRGTAPATAAPSGTRAATRAAARSPIPFRPRPSYAKFLAVAAALVAVTGLGIVVSQANFGADDDDAAGEAADTSADRLTESVAERDMAEDGEDSTAALPAADAGDDTADAGGAAESTMSAAADAAEEMSEEAVAEAELASDAGAADEGTGGAPDSVPADFDPDAPITDASDLAAFGAYLRGERAAGELAPTPNTPCTGEYEVLRRASLLDGDTVVPVLVAVDDTDGRTLAVDEDSCTVLLVTP